MTDSMTAEERLGRAQTLMTQWLDLPGHAAESGLGAEERERAEAKLMLDLALILEARKTCIICGIQYPLTEAHEHAPW